MIVEIISPFAFTFKIHFIDDCDAAAHHLLMILAERDLKSAETESNSPIPDVDVAGRSVIALRDGSTMPPKAGETDVER